jgi:hypothetical protein
MSPLLLGKHSIQKVKSILIKKKICFSQIGRQIDGIWHTAVVVFGREYFFGSQGITSCSPVSD